MLNTQLFTLDSDLKSLGLKPSEYPPTLSERSSVLESSWPYTDIFLTLHKYNYTIKTRQTVTSPNPSRHGLRTFLEVPPEIPPGIPGGSPVDPWMIAVVGRYRFEWESSTKVASFPLLSPPCLPSWTSKSLANMCIIATGGFFGRLYGHMR